MRRSYVLWMLAGMVGMGTGAPVVAADQGPGTVVGRVTNTSSRIKGRKVFVQADSRKWALHLGTSKVYHAGVEVSIHDIDTGTFVKAKGRRIGKLRLDVERLDIAGDRAAYRKSGVYRRSQPEGYFVPYYVR